MSQQKKRGSSSRSSNSAASGGAAQTGNTARSAAHRPAQPQPQRSRSEQVNKALPPFTVRRYVAIWALGMIPLLLVIWVLIQGQQRTPATSSGAAAVASATLQSTTAPNSSPTTAQATSPALAQTPASSTPAGGATAVSSPAANATAPGKYLVLDTAKGQIVAKLYTEASAGVSKTIANFEQKANSGAFNGRIFHRVENWVIQGGDPSGNGTGGGTMPSEYNNLPFKAGALGVARGQDPAINNDSQFFIVKTDSDFLNGQYTNWGQVVQGMDVVNKIAIGDKITGAKVENR